MDSILLRKIELHPVHRLLTEGLHTKPITIILQGDETADIIYNRMLAQLSTDLPGVPTDRFRAFLLVNTDAEVLAVATCPAGMVRAMHTLCAVASVHFLTGVMTLLTMAGAPEAQLWPRARASRHGRDIAHYRTTCTYTDVHKTLARMQTQCLPRRNSKSATRRRGLGRCSSTLSKTLG